MTATLRVAQEFGLYGFQDIDATIDFLEKFWRWWEMHDICNRTQYVQQRREDKMPFYSVDDPRLSWLQEDFLNWLDEWKKESDAILAMEGAQRMAQEAKDKKEAKKTKATNGQGNMEWKEMRRPKNPPSVRFS